MTSGFGVIPAAVNLSSATESGVGAEMAATTAAGAAALTGVIPMAADGDPAGFAQALNATGSTYLATMAGSSPAADCFCRCADVGIGYIPGHGRDPRHRPRLTDQDAGRPTVDRSTRKAIAATFEAGSPASVISNNLVWATETSHHEMAAGVSSANTATTGASWQGRGSNASAAAANVLNAELHTTAGWTAHGRHPRCR